MDSGYTSICSSITLKWEVMCLLWQTGGGCGGGLHTCAADEERG